MDSNNCSICGGSYEYKDGRWICPYCGAYKPEGITNEEVTLLYNAAQLLRLAEFADAEAAYSDIVSKFPKNSEGYWGRLLSRYGIKYEDDVDGKKIPTCYATSIESVIDEKDFIKAVELADIDTRAYYEKHAEYIERIRKIWIDKAQKEKPYDIFICYKDSDSINGIERTTDSIAAQELYIHLVSQGYRVFFSRESLRDKVGEKYEPYIFNALSTAKVMIVYGSNSDYINSTWLKNEWRRYKKRLDAAEKAPNSLIVACDGFSPSELPTVLSSMQCLDATKKSFYGDLDNAILKIIRPKPIKTEEKLKADRKKKKITFWTFIVAVLVAAIICMSIFIPKATHTNVISNTDYGITIESDEALRKGTVVDIASIESGEKYVLVQSKLPIECTSFKLYDLELTKDGKTVDVNGNVKVTLPIPSGASLSRRFLQVF